MSGTGSFRRSIAGLGLLFLLLVPLSWRLARRLQRSSIDRAVLLQRAIDSSETERWRIAGDLHDGPVQNLTAVSLTLGSAAMRLANPERAQPSHEELLSVMQTASEESRTAIRELRTMIMEIAPPDLDRGGLGAALERLGAVARDAGLEVVVDVDPSARTLSMQDTALIYRTAQEAIRNVVKHAHARRLMVRLLPAPKAMDLEVTDDGDGFSPDGAQGPAAVRARRALAAPGARRRGRRDAVDRLGARPGNLDSHAGHAHLIRAQSPRPSARQDRGGSGLTCELNLW